MKKANLSPKHQARREGALARFSIKAKAKGQDQASYDDYVQRKLLERSQLETRLAGRRA